VSLIVVADLMVRGGIVALLLLWSWLLLRDHRQSLAARIAVGMNVATFGHVLASIPNMDSGWRLLDAAVDILSTGTIGLFWLFARAWFSDRRAFGWGSWLFALTPPIMVTGLYLSGSMFGGFDQYVWFPVLRLIWLGMIAHALWSAWRGRAGDLIETRRRMRLAVILVTAGLSLTVLAVELGVFRFGVDQQWRSLPELAILIGTFALMVTMLAHRQGDLFDPGERGRPTPPPVTGDPLVERLLAHMDHERPHRDEGLSIAALAAQLGEQEYRLRRLINGNLGHRNFAQFLNGYRLDEVRGALADPAQREVPILTIALDAGFGSLGPFNRAFRDAEGMTPSEYRTRTLSRSLVDSGIG
jgi:AraC-like DNA-binding protein